MIHCQYLLVIIARVVVIRQRLGHHHIVIEVPDIVIDVVERIPEVHANQLEMLHIPVLVCDKLKLEGVEPARSHQDRLVLETAGPVVERCHDSYRLEVGVERHPVAILR